MRHPYGKPVLVVCLRVLQWGEPECHSCRVSAQQITDQALENKGNIEGLQAVRMVAMMTWEVSSDEEGSP